MSSEKSLLRPLSSLIRQREPSHWRLTQRDRDSPRYQSAQKACTSVAPPGFEKTPAEIAQRLAEETAEDACIRKHGVPNMPDPSAQGSQTFPPGITASSPQFQEAQKVCAYLNP